VRQYCVSGHPCRVELNQRQTRGRTLSSHSPDRSPLNTVTLAPATPSEPDGDPR
jgi:hypothetical protein